MARRYGASFRTIVCNQESFLFDHLQDYVSVEDLELNPQGNLLSSTIPTSIALSVVLIFLSSCAENEVQPAPQVMAIPKPSKAKSREDSESPAEKSQRLELLRSGSQFASSCAAPASPQIAPQKKVQPKPPTKTSKQSPMTNMADCWRKPVHHHKGRKQKAKQVVSSSNQRPPSETSVRMTDTQPKKSRPPVLPETKNLKAPNQKKNLVDPAKPQNKAKKPPKSKVI